jgi:hypothetical protein
MDGVTTLMDFNNSPECYATNEIFLESLGWCLSSYCDGKIPVYQLEEWWLLTVAGR